MCYVTFILLRQCHSLSNAFLLCYIISVSSVYKRSSPLRLSRRCAHTPLSDPLGAYKSVCNQKVPCSRGVKQPQTFSWGCSSGPPPPPPHIVDAQLLILIDLTCYRTSCVSEYRSGYEADNKRHAPRSIRLYKYGGSCISSVQAPFILLCGTIKLHNSVYGLALKASAHAHTNQPNSCDS